MVTGISTPLRAASATPHLSALRSKARRALYRRRRPVVGMIPGMGSIPVTGVSELVLEVVDLAAAEAFYAGALGLPVVERWPDREAIWVMAGDRTRIGLWRPQVGLARGRGGIHVHYAMHLHEAHYDAAVTRLRAHGLKLEEHTFPLLETGLGSGARGRVEREAARTARGREVDRRRQLPRHTRPTARARGHGCVPRHTVVDLLRARVRARDTQASGWLRVASRLR
jgi:catechol 2,3-dioxygenase-like lactoylglutathione lyase family enzyme